MESSVGCLVVLKLKIVKTTNITILPLYHLTIYCQNIKYQNVSGYQHFSVISQTFLDIVSILSTKAQQVSILFEIL